MSYIKTYEITKYRKLTGFYSLGEIDYAKYHNSIFYFYKNYVTPVVKECILLAKNIRKEDLIAKNNNIHVEPVC
jgi:hypothetical protein